MLRPAGHERVMTPMTIDFTVHPPASATLSGPGWKDAVSCNFGESGLARPLT
jgi:hypothetical protein